MKSGHAAIVTGATGALGGAVTAHLVSLGWRVVVPYRDARSWQTLAALAAGEALIGIEVDISEEAGARSFVAEAAARLGGIDAAALVAGGWAGGARFEDAPAGELGAMLKANLETAAHVCRAALPHLVRSRGSVVAVGSLAAEKAGAGMAAYAMSKSALHALVRVLALENRERGVRVNAVLPGTIDTPANRAAMPGVDASSWSAPDDIAHTIAFLLSPASRPVTGALVPV
jgi:NAD(P)-dependent dehydrogenase (short-subunit alcohol dehydrogenase family)